MKMFHVKSSNIKKSIVLRICVFVTRSSSNSMILVMILTGVLLSLMDPIYSVDAVRVILNTALFSMERERQ